MERIGMSNILSKKIIGLVAVSLASSACGGGGGGSATVAPASLGTAEGLWTGMTGSGRTFSGLLLDDGTYWFLYTAVGNSAVLGGAVQGTGISSNGTFTSSNGMDFNLEGAGILNFTMAGTYTEKSKLGGTLTYSGGTNTFTSTYDTNYDLSPSLATIAGTYSGQAKTVNSGPELATVMIAGGGAITGTSASGCSFTGTAAPRAKGNVYNVSVTFSGGNCDNGTNIVTGVAYYAASNKTLVSTALNSGRTNGFIFLGAKP
jgi:hypothetical protein